MQHHVMFLDCCCRQHINGVYYANCTNLVYLDISFVDALIRTTKKVRLKWENMWCNKHLSPFSDCAIRSWLAYLHFAWSWQMLVINIALKFHVLFDLHWLKTWDENNKTCYGVLIEAEIVFLFRCFQVSMEYHVFWPIHIPILSTNSHGCRCSFKL